MISGLHHVCLPIPTTHPILILPNTYTLNQTPNLYPHPHPHPHPYTIHSNSLTHIHPLTHTSPSHHLTKPHTNKQTLIKVNILVPPSTLPLATLFYGSTLGLTSRPVPHLQAGTLAWFDISESGQQLHVAIGRPDVDFTDEARKASRHPCFRVESADKLRELQERIWEQYKRGGEGAPMSCDEPGSVGSGEFFFFLLLFFFSLFYFIFFAYLTVFLLCLFEP